jgi:hypothetical protein
MIIIHLDIILSLYKFILNLTLYIKNIHNPNNIKCDLLGGCLGAKTIDFICIALLINNIKTL